MGDTTKTADRFTITEDSIFYNEFGDEYTVFDGKGRPVFPGYVFEGGYVYSEPGMYGNVALLNIASMHPISIVSQKLFGEEYM